MTVERLVVSREMLSMLSFSMAPYGVSVAYLRYFSQWSGQREGFTREVKLISSLSYSGICRLHFRSCCEVGRSRFCNRLDAACCCGEGFTLSLGVCTVSPHRHHRRSWELFYMHSSWSNPRGRLPGEDSCWG